MKITRLLGLLMALMPLTLASGAHAGAVEDHQASWAYRALQLQLKLDEEAPLSQATFIGTHNSYNASAYATIYRYVDPNQKLSITDQLRVGARALELDVHWYFKFDGFSSGNNLLLCHGQDNHLGCSTGDRYFRDGVREIGNWLSRPENAGEVILLYIEDHMDGRYGKAIDILENYLGNRIFRPSGASCEGIPMDITKGDVLRAGKQVLLITDGCNNADFNKLVFGGIANSLGGYPTASARNIGSCDEGRYSRAFQDGHIIRYNEDRTNLSAVFGDPGPRIDAPMLSEILKCGGNLAGLDDLVAGDSRLQSGSGIWSWGANEPNNVNNEDCAVSRPDGRFNDLQCGASRPYACVDGNGSWLITNVSGRWVDGENACFNATSGTHRFAAPVSSYQNEQLKAAKSQAGASSVWINYDDREKEGEWRANGHSAAQKVVFEELRSFQNNKCLDDSSTRATDGANVHLWDCHGGQNQRWHMDGNGLIHSAVNYRMCVTLPGGGTWNGNSLKMAPCTGGADQRFTFDGDFIRLASNPSRAIATYNSNNGSDIVIWDVLDKANHKWHGVKWVELVSGMGTCLDLDNQRTGNGSNIQSYGCNHSPAQVWGLDRNGAIHSAVNFNKCIDLYAFRTGNGSNIVIWDCNGKANQKWDWVGRSLRARIASGSALDISGASSSNGANIHLWGYHGGPNQQWYQVPAQ